MRFKLFRKLSYQERNFIKKNKEFWYEYTSKSKEGNDKYVLVEDNVHPIILLCNGSFAAIVNHAKGLKPLFMVNSSNSILKKIMRSFCSNSDFIYLNSWRCLFFRIKAYFRAIKAFTRLHSPEDILDFSIDGIRFGDLIYDAVLVRGYATISKIDKKVFTAFATFFFYRYLIKDILKNYNIKTSIFSHTVGLKGGVFSRYLLQRKIEVINRLGSHQIILKKYKDLDDVGFYPLKPERKYFSYMLNYCNNTIINHADKYLQDRFSQKVNHVAVELAFDRKKNTFTNANDFCKYYKLDPNKKLVFVMLHAFNDQPHSHFASRMIFRDYYDWFIKTLEIAKLVDNVNWIFKEHPAAEFYPTKDIKLEDIFKNVSNPNILFLNRKANFNANSLQGLASAIITCIGTAGLEYSCLGIPSVLGGESPYSDFGFTINPKNQQEYNQYLKNIDKIERLTKTQMQIAKVVLFFQLKIMHDAPYIFCPTYDYRKIKKIKSDELWHDAFELMSNNDPKKMRDIIHSLVNFINNPKYTQYINLEKYGFLKGAVYGK
jgi:hypothetical protein